VAAVSNFYEAGIQAGVPGAITGRGSRRRNTDSLIVPKGLGGHAGVFGDLADGERVRHATASFDRADGKTSQHRKVNWCGAEVASAYPFDGTSTL